MEIYSYAKSINYSADYMDMHTGNIYKIQEYGNAIKNGIPTQGILVMNSIGEILGVARKPAGWED